MCQSSERLQDTLLIKLLGQFIELYKTQVFRRLENLIWDCIVILFLQYFEKLAANLTPESIYIEEECGLKKYRVLKSQ